VTYVHRQNEHIACIQVAARVQSPLGRETALDRSKVPVATPYGIAESCSRCRGRPPLGRTARWDGHGGRCRRGVGHPNTGPVAHAPRRASWLARCLERVNNHLEPTHSSAGRACDRAELSALRLGRGGAVARPSSSRTLDPIRRLPHRTSRSAHSP